MKDRSAAELWASFQRVKTLRPFLRFVAAPGPETPAEIRARHNLVLPVDHAYWRWIAPGLGRGDGWTLQSLSRRDIERMQSEGEQLKFEPPEDADHLRDRSSLGIADLGLRPE